MFIRICLSVDVDVDVGAGVGVDLVDLPVVSPVAVPPQILCISAVQKSPTMLSAGVQMMFFVAIQSMIVATNHKRSTWLTVFCHLGIDVQDKGCQKYFCAFPVSCVIDHSVDGLDVIDCADSNPPPGKGLLNPLRVIESCCFRRNLHLVLVQCNVAASKQHL